MERKRNENLMKERNRMEIYRKAVRIQKDRSQNILNKIKKAEETLEKVLSCNENERRIKVEKRNLEFLKTVKIKWTIETKY